MNPVPLGQADFPGPTERGEPPQAAAAAWGWFNGWGHTIGIPQEPGLERLQRALVAGLMLDVMLANPRWGEESGPRGHHLKNWIKSTLASHLAGHIPLASFHTLAQSLDHWFEVLFPLLSDRGLGRRAAQLLPRGPARGPALLNGELFKKCLTQTPGLLPRRRHRKLDEEKLRTFLESTGGEWFRLRDFEAYFQMDRKTAWEYVQKLLKAGFLRHNHGHSSAVRYRLSSCFLQAAGEVIWGWSHDRRAADFPPAPGPVASSPEDSGPGGPLPGSLPRRVPVSIA